MPPPFEVCREENIDELFGEICIDQSCSHAHDVRIIMRPGKSSGLAAVAHRRSDTPHFVCGHSLTVSRPSEDKARYVFIHHSSTTLTNDLGVIHRVLAECSYIDHISTLLDEMCFDDFFERIASVIGGQDDAFGLLHVSEDIRYTQTMSRTPLIAANWKMNSTPEGAYAKDSAYRTHAGCDVWVFPSFVDLKEAVENDLIVGAQHGHCEPCGAHTGDVGMQMLKDAGCLAVLCGHSERRQGHGETDAAVAEQAIAALEAGLHPVICIGETEQERKKGKEKAVIEKQMKLLPKESQVILAYEPVWAIGTGNTATPQQAQQIHEYIRSLLPDSDRETTRILYGGSVNKENAADLMVQPDIDGALVGGASLKQEEFGAIVASALNLEKKDS